MGRDRLLAAWAGGERPTLGVPPEVPTWANLRSPENTRAQSASHIAPCMTPRKRFESGRPDTAEALRLAGFSCL
jgi:hypothetical protein